MCVVLCGACGVRVVVGVGGGGGGSARLDRFLHCLELLQQLRRKLAGLNLCQHSIGKAKASGA